MKINLEWWLDNCINAHAYMNVALRNDDKLKAKKYAKIATYCHDRILKNYTMKI